MNQLKRDTIIRKLKAMTDGPTPLIHHVGTLGEIVVISVMPWGTPQFLNWAQAEMFANELPLQMPVQRKSAGSERGRRKYAKQG